MVSGNHRDPDTKSDLGIEEHIEEGNKRQSKSVGIHQHNAAIYEEALQRYPNDDAIDQAAERKLRHKIDRRIIPLLGICYFFYVSTEKTI